MSVHVEGGMGEKWSNNILYNICGFKCTTKLPRETLLIITGVATINAPKSSLRKVDCDKKRSRKMVARNKMGLLGINWYLCRCWWWMSDLQACYFCILTGAISGNFLGISSGVLSGKVLF